MPRIVLTSAQSPNIQKNISLRPTGSIHPRMVYFGLAGQQVNAGAALEEGLRAARPAILPRPALHDAAPSAVRRTRPRGIHRRELGHRVRRVRTGAGRALDIYIYIDVDVFLYLSLSLVLSLSLSLCFPPPLVSFVPQLCSGHRLGCVHQKCHPTQGSFRRKCP